ncbi:hypothetical protein PENSPDRAFT_735624 [Peniophora sp. CONT]|nr:hypothetical protein PENSPDRAFT_735624 [Peniophora sp. CONT]
MSSDGDELDGFNPTTPAAKLAAAAKSKRAVIPKISALNTSLNGAGPSNAASKVKPPATKRTRAPPPSAPADVEVISEDDAMEVEETVAPTKVKAKAKGKAKSESKPKPIETVDIPDSGDERAAAVRRPRAQKAKASSPPALASDPHINALERENERLKRQLEQSQERETDLHDAFNQFQASKEAEEADVQTQVAQLHSLLAVKDEKYHALEAEFRRSKKATLVPLGDPHFVHILTPEAAEKERLQLQLKLDEAIAASEAKDARIRELEQELEAVTLERDGEIQRANQLQKDLKANSGQRSHEPTIVVRGDNSQGPLHSAAVRFYEELTNLLITRVKETPNTVKPGTITTIYDCVYTPRASEEPYDALLSLNFTIQQGWMVDEHSEIVYRDTYFPHLSDIIDPDDSRLQALKGNMSFDHTDMHVFGKELMCGFLHRWEGNGDSDGMDMSR